MDREVVVVTKVYYGVPGIIPIGKLPQVNQQNCPSAVRKLSPRVPVGGYPSYNYILIAGRFTAKYPPLPNP